MFFERRPHNIKTIDDAGELADKLTSTTWCLCNGFRIGDVIFINDSTSEDGAAEFAVIEVDSEQPTHGKQIESITFGWLHDDVPAALEHIINALRGTPESTAIGLGPNVIAITSACVPDTSAATVPINPHPAGYNSCYYCA
jgi:hypothetical protein